MIDKRDVALQASCPVTSQPMFSAMETLDRNGERLILASNGTFLEVRRPWARFIVQVGTALTSPVPYGPAKEVVELTADRIPRALLSQFVAWAQEDSAVEIGGVITWNQATGEYALLRSKSNHATSASLAYEIPQLPEGTHVVVDCHSHSHHDAFFSATDDADDRFSVKYAFVVGHCHTSNPSIASRLCVRGVFKNLNWKI